MMNNINPFQIKSLIAAFILPLLVTVGGSSIFARVIGSPSFLTDEWSFLLRQIIMAAIPFVILVFIGSTRFQNEGKFTLRGLNLSLALAIIGTLIFWGYFWFSGISYQLSDGTGGANIGLGLLMSVSPVLIALLIPVGLYLGKDK